jgi:uncharacterized membrane protein
MSDAAAVVVSNEEWERVRAACVSVLAGSAIRIDGNGWKVYMAGTVLRVDVPA